MKSTIPVVITALLFLAVHGYDRVGESDTQQQRKSQPLGGSDIRILKHLENTVGEYNVETNNNDIASSVVSFMGLRLRELRHDTLPGIIRSWYNNITIWHCEFLSQYFINRFRFHRLKPKPLI